MASDTVTTATLRPEPGDFGLMSVRLQIQPDADQATLAAEAQCLLENAAAIFETMADHGNVSGLHFAGLYLLRQAQHVLEAAQLTPAQAAAVAAVGR